MLSQKNLRICLQSVDKVNTPRYNTSVSKVNTPKETEMIEKILIRVPREIKERIKAHARSLGITMNALILQILWAWANDGQTKHGGKDNDKV